MRYDALKAGHPNVDCAGASKHGRRISDYRHGQLRGLAGTGHSPQHVKPQLIPIRIIGPENLNHIVTSATLPQGLVSAQSVIVCHRGSSW